MPISCRPVDGHKTISICELSGRIDASVVPQLRQELDNLVEQGKSRLVVNMAELDSISAAGLSLFITFAQQTKTRKGGIRFAGARPGVRRIMGLLGLDKLFAIAETEEAAVQDFTGGK